MAATLPELGRAPREIVPEALESLATLLVRRRRADALWMHGQSRGKFDRVQDGTDVTRLVWRARSREHRAIRQCKSLSSMPLAPNIRH